MLGFALLLCLHGVLGELTFKVKPQSKDCFYEDLEALKSFVLEFEVLRGGLLDIRLIISDPNSRNIKNDLVFFNNRDDVVNARNSRVEFQAQTTGTHEICFDNTMSRWTAKDVTFRVVTSEKKDQDNLATLSSLGPMVDSVINLDEEMDKLEKLQHYHRVHEQNHRDAIEATNARVQWLSIIEAVVLISLSALQLRFIRQWFKDGQRVGSPTQLYKCQAYNTASETDTSSYPDTTQDWANASSM
eukprot:g2662.t1